MPSVQVPQGTISYREEGQGQPVVLVHGLLLDGRFFDEVVPKLADRFRVITPDLPLGCHKTPLNEDADLSTRGLAKLIADFLEALDLRDVVLVGNDTGGALAHVCATRHPERIGKLVLNSCDLEENFLPPMFKPLELLAGAPGSMFLIGMTLRYGPLQQLPNAIGWLSHKTVDPKLVASMSDPLRSDKGVQRDMRKVLKGIDSSATVQAAQDLRSFDKPTLWMWGADDKFFPVEQARRIAGTMPDARFEVVENSRTYTPIDQPGRFASLVADFAGQGAEAPSQATVT